MKTEQISLVIPYPAYFIADHSGSFVVWEDGHFDLSRDMNRVVKSSFMWSRPDKSFHAIGGRDKNLRIMKVQSVVVTAEHIPVLPTFEEVAAKAKALGLTSDELQVLRSQR